MKLGITGTRHGCTLPQQLAYLKLLIKLDPTHLHQGACRGADEQAAKLSRKGGRIIVAHPGKSAAGADNAWLSDEALQWSNEVRPTKTHFARNRDIINETDALVALPGTMEPITVATRGGTAYTINEARKQGKPIYVVRPDGSVEFEEGRKV